jgi:hypothetical protein
MNKFIKEIAMPVVLTAALVLPLSAQDIPGQVDRVKQDAPKVFFDCHQCDMDYIRTEITFVNFVRERKQADVFVMVTIQSTGSGGREYTLDFIGQNGYVDIRNTLKYITKQGDTDDEQRRGLVRVIKVGLVPYAAKTAVGDFINVNFERKVSPMAVVDHWNSWVFNVGMNMNLRGEKQKNFSAINGHLSINRVTAVSKLRLGFSADYNNSSFQLDNESISSTSDSQSFSGLYVVSLDEHWSAGSWLSFTSSSYNNIAFSINPSPAVEYSFFPYSESTRRQLRVLYRVGYSYNKYMEETIFDKIREGLLGQTMTMTLEIKEPWGNISSSLQGSNYFHDLGKNRLEFWGGLNLQLWKGLSLGLYGQYSRINDQISLPKAGASLEDILLQKRMLATNYNYGFSVGVNYTFGSIYSNIVNPRFGK